MIAHIASSLALALIATSPPVSLNGTYALQSGRSQTKAHLVATQLGASPLDERLDLWLTKDTTQPIRSYELDMTKYLHLIAVSDDFTAFVHVHPVLGADGHFRLDVHFPKEGVYHVYADAEPSGIGQQVFRYDLRVGSADGGARDIAPTSPQAAAGPYRVSLGSTHLRVGAADELTVHITRDGKPAGDLRPYLGALAHAVFIDAGDLSYAHVHPIPLDHTGHSMSGMSGMSDMNMALQELWWVA
jgi:hypothetical protein